MFNPVKKFSDDGRILFSEMEVVRQPFPGIDLVNGQTWLSIGQWCEKQEGPKDCSKDHSRRNPTP